MGGPADLAVLAGDPRVGTGVEGASSQPVEVVAIVRAGRVETGWPDPRAAEALEHRTVTVADGIDLVVDEWRPSAGAWAATAEAPVAADAAANAPPFVLVHGLASNARLWDGVATALAGAGHRVFAVDLRGHGRSSKPAGPYDLPTVAVDLGTVIERLGIERPVVAGQSWGGNVVLELAARRPELVRGIVCVDGGWLQPGRDFADWDACRAALSPPRLAGRQLVEIEGYLRSAHPDWPETGLRGVLANFELRPDGTVAPWLSFDHHVKVLHGLWEHRPSELYAGLAGPVLLVPADGGESDRLRRKRRDVDTAAAVIPNARVRWFTGDHDIHAQHPAELAGVMHDMTADGFFA
jgi:pimeloyl-ACP methyl ester carboxylesterase